jgi:hypothetical protein
MLARTSASVNETPCKTGAFWPKVLEFALHVKRSHDDRDLPQPSAGT